MRYVIFSSLATLQNLLYKGITGTYNSKDTFYYVTFFLNQKTSRHRLLFRETRFGDYENFLALSFSGLLCFLQRHVYKVCESLYSILFLNGIYFSYYRVLILSNVVVAGCFLSKKAVLLSYTVGSILNLLFLF